MNNLPIYAICFHKQNKRILQDNNSSIISTNNSSINSTNSSSINSTDSSHKTNAEIKNSTNFSNEYTENRHKINSQEKDKPHFLITSGYRGSDYISVSMALFIIKYMLHGYVNNNSDVNYILENRVIWFI